MRECDPVVKVADIHERNGEFYDSLHSAITSLAHALVRSGHHGVIRLVVPSSTMAHVGWCVAKHRRDGVEVPLGEMQKVVVRTEYGDVEIVCE